MDVAREAGRYLVEAGREECWRVVYLLLLARFDFYGGWGEGYALGDEAEFLESAGGWAAYRAEEEAAATAVAS